MIGAHSMIFDTDFHHSDPNKRQDRTDIPARPVVIEIMYLLALIVRF